MAEALSFLCPRNPSFGLHPSFNFEAINRNLLEEFDEGECTIAPKNEQMPVFLRVRPLNPGESSTKVVFTRGPNAVIIRPSRDEKNTRSAMFKFGQSSHEFSFSRVFDETTSQSTIFKEVVSDRVSELLQGINGLVFAYGTTSSGKTYTLQGSVDVVNVNACSRLIPRGGDELCGLTDEQGEVVSREKALLLRLAKTVESSSRTCAQNWESQRPSDSEESLEDLRVSVTCKESFAYSFWISFVEIYNEIAYDLLDPDVAQVAVRANSTGGNQLRGVGPCGIRRTPLELRTDRKGNVFVKGLRWFAVSTPEEARQLLMVGRCCQQVGATKLNQISSRSHCLFSIKAMRAANKDSPRFVRVSSLTFCDLAGSERCEKAATLNQAHRLREANNINASLLALGKKEAYFDGEVMSGADLVEIIKELMDTVSRIPEEVEKAKKEVHAQVSSAMGEELLRMEEQYESLLQAQEKEFEAKLLGRKRRGKSVLSRKSVCVSETSILVDDLEDVVEGTQVVAPVAPLEKLARVVGNEGLNDDDEVELEEEEDVCASCAEYEKEVERLKCELEDARGDLADQQDAISTITQERDGFQVEIRRLQYLLQLTKQSEILAPVTGAGPKPSTTLFPPLVSCESSNEKEASNSSGSIGVDPAAAIKKPPRKFFPPIVSPVAISEDDDIIPPTPATVVKVKRRSLVEMVSRVETRRTSDEALSCLRGENEQCVCGSDAGVDSECKVSPGLQSFLAHEAEAAIASSDVATLEARCNKLEAELAEMKSSYEKATSELDLLKKSVAQVDVSCETDFQWMPSAVEGNVGSTGVSEASNAETAASMAVEVKESVGEKRGKRGAGAKGVKRRNLRLRSTATVKVPISEAPDSDSENVLSEHLAIEMTQIQAASACGVDEPKISADVLSTTAAAPPKRRGGRAKTAEPPSNRRVTRSMSSDGGDQAALPKLSAGVAMRKLAPLIETSQFLQAENSLILAEEVSRGIANLQSDVDSCKQKSLLIDVPPRRGQRTRRGKAP
ncbi:unnamed protein product [Mesocestoides corti]|uniref:Kinesin motor domain-containing protein n=2 Tax=Mesocestoides corti TaxID=53468 RepID=A0A0R3UQV8_MESCO|nr:unnamed protein product [Mesocestoides corti]